MKLSYRPLSIGQKFILVTMLIAFVSASVTAGIILYYEKLKAQEALRTKLELMSNIISPNLTAAVAFDDLGTAYELIAPTTETEGVISAFVYSENKIFSQAHKNSAAAVDIEDRFEVVTPLRMDDRTYGSLIIYADDSVVESKFMVYQIFVGQILLGALVLSLIFSLILSRLATQPLSKLIKAAKEISSSNNYTIRVARKGSDEIGELTDCFNSMLEAIEHRDRVLESEVIARTKDLEQANSKLHLQANEDALCGLPNRRALYKHLTAKVNEREPFSLLFIDLDGFKGVNDTLGHDMGDLLLQGASERILSSVRKTDFVARLGGDEFTVVLSGLVDSMSVDRIAGGILKKLSEPFFLKDDVAYVSGSIGITLHPQDSHSVDILVKQADQAMYESKRLGKNCFNYFSQEMQLRLNAKRTLVDDLREGISKNQFCLHYQPIVDLQTGDVCKAEALVRWNHPQKGLLYPGEFLSTVEEEGFMDELGYWIATQATNDAARWMRLTDSTLQISINLSPTQFAEGGLLDSWLNYLHDLNFEAQNLVVEITEHSLIENSQYVKQTLERMRAKGIGIAIDDFGVGYSSLSYLQKLNLDILKIDRSFMSSLKESDNSYALCRAIITIAHELGLKVVAEGIETEEQKELLIEAGCDFGQGYLFSKPLSVDEFEERFTNIRNPAASELN